MSDASSPELSPPKTTFIRFRLSHIESVISWKDDKLYDQRDSPFSDQLKGVPIVRIYGATDQGQRVVAHVHGVFPYSYIEYTGSLDPDEVATYIKTLARSLNVALDRFFPSKYDNPEPQYIAFIVLCKGIPFYGYHVGYKTYLKIYVSNKNYVKKMGEILRSGVVMDKRFDVFEEHVGSILQFMLDSNLYGCGWVEVGEDCKMRYPLPEHDLSLDEIEPVRCDGPFATRIYDDKTIPLLNRHEEYDVDQAKLSHCALELDFSVESILNRHLVQPRLQQSNFMELLKPDSIDKDKLVHSVRELWNNERVRRATKGDSGPNNVTDPEMLLPRDWDDRPEGTMHWNVEQKLRDAIEILAEKDLKKFQDSKGYSKLRPEFKKFVGDSAKIAQVNIDRLAKIRTTYDQVAAIYPSQLILEKMERYEYGIWKLGCHGAAERARSGSPEKADRFRDVQINNELLMKVKEEPEENEYYEEDGDPGVVGLADDSEEEELEDLLLKDESIPAPFQIPTAEEDSQEEFDSEIDLEEEGPPLKKAKIDPASLLASAARLASLPQSSRHDNPFSNPSPGSRHTVSTHQSPNVTRQNSELPESPPSQSNSARKRYEDVEAMLEDLPSDALSDYVPTPDPTPTIRDPGPSTIPLHLRYASPISEYEMPVSNQERRVEEEEVEASGSIVIEESPISSLRSNRSSSALAISSLGSEGKKMVKFDLPDEGMHSGSDTEADLTLVPVVSQRSEASKTDSILLDVSRNSVSSSNSSLSRRLIPFNLPISRNSYAYAIPPPTTAELLASLPLHHIPEVVYRSPYFSNPEDVLHTTSISGERKLFKKSYGGRNFTIEGDTIHYKKQFERFGKSRLVMRPPGRRKPGIKFWQFGRAPPSFDSMAQWIAEEDGTVIAKNSSQIEGPTQISGGFKIPTVKGAASAVNEKQHLDILALELQINTREVSSCDGSSPTQELLPDPAVDSIQALFYCLQTESETIEKNGRDHESSRHLGIIAVGPNNFGKKIGMKIKMVDTELEMIRLFLKKVREDWDPEICTGYEVHHSSWGYLLERAEAAYPDHPDMCDLAGALGRLKTKTKKSNLPAQSSTPSFCGRHVLPIWRILKEDTKLCGYTFENVVFHLLRQRTPYFSHSVLTKWYNSDQPSQIARVFAYWKNRVEMDIEMIEEGEIVSQTCEFAQVFGVDFESVRTRGSQFKVESVMLRIAKPESYLLLSPNRVQVGQQNAAECTPLIMEPIAAFYKGPLLVLDFQSLYPSVMIAYNYCYSTCLGRIGDFKKTDKFGITNYTPSPGLLSLMEEKLNVSPNGFMFVKAEVRKSLLAKMLGELLDTRVMVKGSMKLVKEDKALLRLMNARQLGLKLLANVTYGYTSATFSGRMPCVEIADAIVQTGRETLEKAIATIKQTSVWGAEVVYGDTDSLFVYLPGKSKEDAFRIGQEIVDKVTSMNPRPIKLKFEKVYLPCVLLAKKKYVGFKYEHLSEIEPEFDAKGIETVRRDGFPALQKMEEKCIKILFRTSDLSQVKAYCQDQWKKMLLGKVSPQDFIYAKEVRMGSYSEKGKPPPGAAVSGRRMQVDKRSEPEYGERVPYLITIDKKGTAQVDRALTPEELLSDPRIRLDMEYYILKTIMPLSRIFNLLGADVLQWYKTMPKFDRLVKSEGPNNLNPVLLDEHYSSDRCRVCERQHNGVPGLCYRCEADPATTLYKNTAKVREMELKANRFKQICAQCSGGTNIEIIECTSVDCHVYYSRKKVEKEISELVDIV